MQSVASHKSPLPILSNTLLSASGPGSVRLCATNLNLAVSGSVPADVVKTGSVAIPARELVERLKMMPEGPVHLMANGNDTIAVKTSGSRRFTLKTLPVEDFPEIQVPPDDAPTVELDAGVLQKLIAKTHFSILPDDTRPHLNAALFEWDGDLVRMVTTDGHRLSKMELTVDGPSSTTMLIPLKALLELKRLCDNEPKIRITQSGAHAFFQGAGMSLSMKLVDAQFPPYAQVIPRSFKGQITIPRAPLTDAIRAVSVASNERNGGVNLTIAKGALSITSESPETGEGFDELPIDYAGPTTLLKCSAKYILDVLTAMDDDEVNLQVSEGLDPITLRPSDESSGFVAVIMPMRT